LATARFGLGEESKAGQAQVTGAQWQAFVLERANDLLVSRAVPQDRGRWPLEVEVGSRLATGRWSACLVCSAQGDATTPQMG
jgi:hypothetical protein